MPSAGLSAAAASLLTLLSHTILISQTTTGFVTSWRTAPINPTHGGILPRTLTTTTSPTPTFSATRLFAMKRRGRPRGPVRTIEQKPPMNNEIKQDMLRVVTPNPNGKDVALGIMSKSEALAKAKEMGGVDLILINANSDPPVCKIEEYSKYRYNKEKKAKMLKKNSKVSEMKEVKMSYKIDVHDYDVRKKNALKFLQQGNRVKCTVQFKGREVQHDNLGHQLLLRLAEDLTKTCVMEGKPKREGRNLSSILSPRAEVMKAINDKRRAEERAAKKLREATRKGEDKGVVAGAAVAGVAGVAGALVNDDEDDDDDDEMLIGEDDDEEYEDDDDDDYEDDDDEEVGDDEDVGDLIGSDELVDDLFS